MAKGIVKLTSKERSFGFIICDETSREYFFNLAHVSLKNISPQDEVHFFPVKDEQDRDRAVKVRKIFRDQNGRGYVKNWKADWVHFEPEEFLPFISDDIPKIKDFHIQQFNFNRLIGSSELVDADEHEVFYAIRNGRRGHSRLVTGKNPLPCKSLVMTMRSYHEELTEIVSGYIGVMTPPEPYSENASHESVEFWKKKALRAESFSFDNATRTENSPW